MANSAKPTKSTPPTTLSAPPDPVHYRLLNLTYSSYIGTYEATNGPGIPISEKVAMSYDDVTSLEHNTTLVTFLTDLLASEQYRGW
jgi:hypothetical protein